MCMLKSVGIQTKPCAHAHICISILIPWKGFSKLRGYRAYHNSNSRLTKFRNANESYNLSLWSCTEGLPIRIFQKKWKRSNSLVNNFEFMEKYPLLSEFHIYPDYQQSKHEDSSRSRKDLYQWMDSTLKRNINIKVDIQEKPKHKLIMNHILIK